MSGFAPPPTSTAVQSNEKPREIVLPDNSVLIQIRINGQLLPPQIMPLAELGAIPFVCQAQITTYQTTMAEQAARAARSGANTDETP